MGVADSPSPRWGLGDAAAGYLIANIAALVGGAVILAAAGYQEASSDEYPLWVRALLQVPLWLGYLGVPWWAARTKGNGLVEDFGVRFRLHDAPLGLAVGAVTQLIALPLLYAPLLWFFDDLDVEGPARSLADRAGSPVGIGLLVIVTVIGAPIIEEIFWRGLVLRSLERRVGATPALVLSALAFGAAHFQLVQLPGLFLAGLVFGVLSQRSGRLGPAVWAHVGFNGAAVSVLVVTS